MSRDIYDQFRAAQEALAAKAAEEARRLNEAAQRASAVEATRKAEVIKAANEKQRLRDEKIATQREALQPVAQQLQDILEAIKTHDPRIQAAKLKEVVTNTQILGTEDDPRLVFLYFLRWGNKFGTTPREDHQIAHPKRGFVASMLGLATPPQIVGEDFQQIAVTANLTTVGPLGESAITLGTDDFVNDNSLIYDPLAQEVENPIRRYIAYKLGSYITGGKGPRIEHLEYYLTDIHGKRWDSSSVTQSGKRAFVNNPPEEIDNYATANSGDSW